MNTSIARRIGFPSLALAIGCALVAARAIGQEEARWGLEGALDQLSDQARQFETALARVSAEWKDAAGAVTRSGNGTFYATSDGDMRFEVEGDEPRVILVADRSVFIYEPDRLLVEEFPLSQHPDRLEPFAALGFSSTGDDLERDYLITVLGEELTGSRRLLELELTPKDDAERSVVARLSLWIDQASWLPVRQEIVHPESGETLTVTYDQMARNLPLDRDLFRARWPRDVEQIRR